MNQRFSLLAAMESRCLCRSGSRLLSMLIAIAAFALPPLFLRASDDSGSLLCEQPPYDEIRLTAENGGGLLKVAPLELAERRAPDAPDPADEIEIRLSDRPDKQYRLAWRHVESIRFFEERVLAEAQQLTDQRRFEDAQRDFRWLVEHNCQLTDFRQALEEFAWRRAEDSLTAKSPEQTLPLLEEVWRINPAREGLGRAFQQPTNQLFERYLREGKWRAARRLVDQFRSRFPQGNRETIERWSKLLARASELRLKAARESLERADFVAAFEQTRHALECQVDSIAARELRAQLLTDHPVVRVGVVAPNDDASDAWSEQRIDSLLYPRLVEPSAPRDDALQSRFGKWIVRQDGRRCELLMENVDNRIAANGAMGAALVRALSRATDQRSSTYDARWADSLLAIGMPAMDRLAIEFREPRPWPAAWLRIPRLATDGEKIASAVNLVATAYRPTNQTVKECHFQWTDVSPRGDQPELIVERCFPTSMAALQALAANDVDVVDRVTPWELWRASLLLGASLARYRQPTIHLLVATSTDDASRDLRRGLANAIDRDAILRDEILAGNKQSGCHLLASPFWDSAGSSDVSDAKPNPTAAGQDLNLGRAVVARALRISDPSRRSGPRSLRIGALPSIGETARRASAAIGRQLTTAGILCELATVDPATAKDLVDFVYVEARLDEPAVDLPRLFAPSGPLPHTPQSKTIVRSLLRCGNRSEAERLLRELDRELYESGAVIPLWQLDEFAVADVSLRGVGEPPTSLYDNIRNWRLGTRNEEEATP